MAGSEPIGKMKTRESGDWKFTLADLISANPTKRIRGMKSLLEIFREIIFLTLGKI